MSPGHRADLFGRSFEAIPSDDEAFGAIRVGSETGTTTWPDGADLGPDVVSMYQR